MQIDYQELMEEFFISDYHSDLGLADAVVNLLGGGEVFFKKSFLIIGSFNAKEDIVSE